MKQHQLFFAISLMLNLFSGHTQDYIHFHNDELVLDNGVIRREVKADKREGQIQTTYLGLAGENFNFMDPGNTTVEFRFLLDGEEKNGADSWKISGFETITDKREGQGARIKFLSTGPGPGLEIHIEFMIYPELPVISKKLSIINTGDHEVKIEGIDVEALALKAFPTSVELYTRYGRNKYIGPYEGDWDYPVLVMHMPEERKGVIIGNEAPGVLKRIAYLKGGRDVCAGPGNIMGVFSGAELKEQGFRVKMQREYQGKIFEVRGVEY